MKKKLGLFVVISSCILLLYIWYDYANNVKLQLNADSIAKKQSHIIKLDRSQIKEQDTKHVVIEHEKQQAISDESKKSNNKQYIIPNSENTVEEYEEILPEVGNREQNDKQNDKYSQYKGKVAIIVTGLGLSVDSTKRGISVPHNVSLGFSAYTRDLGKWASQIPNREILLNLPMEIGNNQYDAGLLSITSYNTNQENQEILRKIMDIALQSTNIIGLYSPHDESFTFHLQKALPILSALKKNNLSFLYGNKSYNKELITANKNNIGMKLLTVDNMIDQEVSTEYINNSLKLIEQQARQKGYAIGMIRSYPLSIKMLKSWLAIGKSSDIVVVPISHLFHYYTK